LIYRLFDIFDGHTKNKKQNTKYQTPLLEKYNTKNHPGKHKRVGDRAGCHSQKKSSANALLA
jgi:hypothetical protein